MKRQYIYMNGNEKYHSSYLYGRGVDGVEVYEDELNTLQNYQELDKIPNLSDCPGLVKLEKEKDYRIDEEGYFQYIKKALMGKVYLVVEVVTPGK